MQQVVKSAFVEMVGNGSSNFLRQMLAASELVAEIEMLVQSVFFVQFRKPLSQAEFESFRESLKPLACVIAKTPV